MQRIRHFMELNGLDAFILPTSDPHDSEYLHPYYQTRQYFTHFTGSAGTAVITREAAALWTDSRYWLQAAEQLCDTPFVLMRDGDAGTPDIKQWLCTALPQGGRIGLVAETCNQDMLDALVPQDARYEALLLETDPFGQMNVEREPIKPSHLTQQTQTARTAQQKISMFREWMSQQSADCTHYLLNDLSEIAWLLNLRGSDIDYNPVFFAYLIFTPDAIEVFARLDAESEALLQQALGTKAGEGDISYRLYPYDAVASRLRECRMAGCTVFMPSSMNMAMVKACGSGVQYLASPVPEWRMCKDEAEIVGFTQAMTEDGVALVRFRRWLDEALQRGDRLTECSVAARLTAFRREQPHFLDLSFETIAAYGAHGAIVHYEPTAESDVELQPKSFLLLDSGGQYEGGTTDITRTIPLGPLTDEEKRVYTLVLKGHIALSSMVFPVGTTGVQLDVAARYAMWQCGYDFGHGTGHGVGAHLCVHEGPSQIRKNVRPDTLRPFVCGQVVTDEPVVYVAGKFCVRIENVLLVEKDGDTDFGTFHRFRPLTLCPIDLDAIDLTLMSDSDKAWLNAYHERVRTELMPYLSDTRDADWLVKATRAI